MIRETKEPTRDAPADPVLGGYRLDASPRRREAGSLLFSVTGPDGRSAAMQVSAQPVQSRRARARFRRLARARARLDQPAMLAVRDVGEADGRLFVVTEPFPARSLADVLRTGRLEPKLALRVLREVADGLDAAHAGNLVHQTLSPESVLLDGDRAKLDLFGLFTVVGQPGWGDVVRRDAHLHYESPEAVRGEGLTPASNVYSLAGLLFHALTGEQPYVNHDPIMISYAHVSQPPPKASGRNPELPAGLDAVLARGMAKDPRERPESAGALLSSAAMVLRTAPYAQPEPRTPKLTPPEAAPTHAAVSAPTPVPATNGSSAAPVANGSGASAPAAASSPAPAPASPAAPAAASSLAPAPAVRQRDARARPRRPLKARLLPLWPLLVALLVGAAFGALLGAPGSGSEQAASPARSADERAVERLDDVRFRLRDDLAFATTTQEQADLAQRLAMAYGGAADNLGSPELVSAAKRVSLAYVGLERAARAKDESGYETAREHVDTAESELGSALSRLDRGRGATQ
jgi:serine/threonine protein kinase